MNKDREHGDYSLEWRGDILILRLSGAFNEDAIQAFFFKVADSLKQRDKKPWVLLSSADQEMLGTPGVIDIIKSAYLWAMPRGCQAAAISGANVVVNHIFKKFFSEIPLTTSIFQEEDEAIDWLGSQVAPPSETK